MGYDLCWEQEREHPESMLHLTVWQMSVIRDQMLYSGALVVAPAPYPPAASDLVARTTVPGRGIPIYKLASIDGWLVRPDEIEETLSILTSSAIALPTEDWKMWLDYLRDAAAHGGFRVG